MNKRLLPVATGLTLLGALISGPAQAGEALDTLNAEVEQRSAVIDQTYGVLLTHGERANLKIGLIVARLKAKKAEQPEKTVADLVDEAVATYEITDPVEQRQLLIETTMQVGGGGGGTKPQPCCG